MKLVEPLQGKDHCLFVDNFYMSLSLLLDLLYLGTCCAGTIQTTRKNFPLLKPDKTHAIGSFQFAIMANILGCFSLRRCGIWLATCNFSLNYWVAANHLTFSSSKCKYMIISRKKNPSHPPALKLGSSTLDRVYSYRYLGLLLTLSLCWRMVDLL